MSASRPGFAAALRPALACALAALLATGCGGGRDGGTTPRPAPSPAPGGPDVLEPPPYGTLPAAPESAGVAAGRPRPGYDRRVDDLRSANVAALRGRRIAVDPGHGGRFPGSIGVRGLTEAEVNLGVALHLWGLLHDAGAEVHLTRTADTDFPAAGDSSLRTDLATRTEQANRWGPEVFLSIHHNADPGRRNNVNEIQTYFRFDDPVASRELAEAIHRRLKRNLGIEADRILPGNFYVLRNSVAPAVLGESSYLTNPDVEARLALAAKQRLEAEAYFLGLADYFARGVPRILAARVEPPAGASADEARERPWLVLETDRPLDGARLVVDGVPVDASAIAFAAGPSGGPGGAGGSGGVARHRPAAPLTDGRHTIEWAARARGGGWSRTVRDTLDVDLPVARVAFDAAPPRDVVPGQLVALRLRALDRHGRPVADTLRASFASRVGAVLVDSLAPRTGAPGEARAYARVTGGGMAALTARATGGPRVAAALAAQELRLPLAASGRPAPWRTGFTRTLAGAPVAGAVVAYDTLRATSNADGFFALPATLAGFADSALALRAAGYVNAGADRASFRFAAIGDGALLGRRIAIDPGGGGADTAGIDLTSGRLEAEGTASAPAVPRGGAAGATLVLDDSLAAADPATAARLAAGDSLARRRAQVIEADANLRVARALREYLEAAGATVLLTRDAPESLSAVDRLLRTEAFRPDRVLVLSHRAAPGTAGAGHYFSSAGGKALAGRIAARLRSRGVAGRAEVGESASYVVAQTAAVATSVNLPSAAPLYVEPTRGAGRLREEAYAIYLALLEDFGSDPRAWSEIVAVVARGDTAAAGTGAAAGAGAGPRVAGVAGVPVSLDGRWTLFTDAAGRVRFEGLPRSARLALELEAPAGGAAPATRRSVWVTTPVSGDVRLTIAP